MNLQFTPWEALNLVISSRPCLGSMRAGDIDCSADEILMMTYMHWSVLFSSRMKGLVWEALSQVSSVQSGCGTFCHQCPDFWRALLLFATQVR
jgi:hypothetical protein